MYAAVRAPLPGVKSYWHYKGMFIHGGDELADARVFCVDNLIEPSAYRGGHKRETLIDQNIEVWLATGLGPHWPCQP